MNPFWNFHFNDSSDFIETFDELPLWSAPFGLFLLKHLDLKNYDVVLDIGSGAGFPLFEIAERLGSASKCYGLDPWKNANLRAGKKIKNYETENVVIIESSAEKIPFQNESIDLIVSNLGINNFENPDIVFKECCRVLRKNCKLVLTTNLNGHWKEFYNVFEETLRQLKKTELIEKLIEQQEHRGSVKSISGLFTENGFTISRTFEESFEMRFLNGSAFLNHHFIKVGWMSSWQGLIPNEEWEKVFTVLEKKLNSFSEENNGLTLTVPMAFIEGIKLNDISNDQ